MALEPRRAQVATFAASDHPPSRLDSGWNVSLFHYRNHGADIGRVLVGLQVPPDEQPQLQDFLDRLGYVGYPETDNAVYKQFLR